MITGSPRTRVVSRRDAALAEVRSYITRLLGGLFILAIALLYALLAIYCANLPGGFLAFGAAAMLSAASYIAGGLLGFLFGIPRALASDAEGKSGRERRRLAANTNLEEVSDWLTKIIVGATLVQLGSIARRFGELATFTSTIFGDPTTQNKVMAGGIILYSVTLGFFLHYIGSRSILTFLLYINPADVIPDEQEVAEQHSTHDEEEPHAQTS